MHEECNTQSLARLYGFYMRLTYFIEKLGVPSLQHADFEVRVALSTRFTGFRMWGSGFLGFFKGTMRFSTLTRQNHREIIKTPMTAYEAPSLGPKY